MLKNLKKITVNSLSELKSETNCSIILQSLQLITKTLIEIESTVEQIQEFVADYDLDAHTPGSGYRSFIYIVEKAAEKIEKIVKNILKNRQKVFFRRNFYEK